MAQILFKLGDIKSACRACALLRGSPECHDKSQLLLKIIDSILSSTATDSSLSDFHDSIKEEIQKQEVSGSSTTVLIFTGLADAATVPLKIIHRIISAHGFSAIYLRDLMIASAKNPPRISLWYGAEMPQDKMHAENLAGLDTLELNPLSGYSGHDVMNELFRESVAQEIYEKFLSAH